MTATKARGRQRAGVSLRRVEPPSVKAAREMSSAKRALAAAPETAATALPENGAGGASGASGSPSPWGAGAFAVAIVEYHGAAWAKTANMVAWAGGSE
jgi:hypothetical protein